MSKIETFPSACPAYNVCSLEQTCLTSELVKPYTLINASVPPTGYICTLPIESGKQKLFRFYKSINALRA